MKTSAILSALISGSAPFLAAAATCNADNCARAATGTYDGLNPTRVASCQSFQRYTVTPPTFTSTSTVTITPTAVTNFPTAIPAFASPCSSNASRYASACSCAGYTKIGITVAPPTTTTTITVTAPAATVVPADA